ncbi:MULTISPECIES: TIGR02680 family protein [unclassified Streptomyces]|uniref:TIGR02680 family protein n=1 Tax=unclassified Streptomyces TaxID=2593676 RepID=UPI00278C597C|nr:MULTISPECIES: TIGR02680 family protein [unclassified Streptomyces]
MNRRPLPAPTRNRWQPLRTGLVDLFYYDREEFWFRDGRLLLRGNNGTGKSKVLALTLPFLLDGDLSARRVEPDGDPKKRMEWNLLLGGEHPHPERLGYTWIEFGRRDEAGREHFRTLLCGLKAVSGRGIARHWFAVTDQRVGADLSLLDATGSALGRDRFAEAIAGHGLVYDQARAYRRAVDEALFGLGEQRYQALVDLLVQLRQPQLSKKPNEAALSKALTEALPPMDQAVVADVAEAFRSLDEEKDTLRAAGEAERAASAFLDHYRRYARVASRRRARLPRTEHARYEQLGRDLAHASQERDGAARERDEAEGRIAELAETAARLKAQDEALREGPEMRSARELERAATEAGRAADARAQAADDQEKAEGDNVRAMARLDEAWAKAAGAEERAAAAVTRARGHANAAALDGEPRVEAGAAAADEALDRRLRTVDHVTRLLRDAEQAEGDRREAQRRLDDTAAELDQCRTRQADAEEAADAAGRDLVERVRLHLASCTELTPADPVGLLDRLQDWAGHLDGTNPANAETARVHRAIGRELAETEASLARSQDETERQAGEARAELERLRSGGQRPPEAPRTRTPGVRDGRPGAPLWRLVDFRDGVRESERAGVEAALEASGLLDAWAGDDGVLHDSEGHDVLLTPGAALPGPHLGELLRPAIDHGDESAASVGEAAVEGLLASIGTGGGAHTWISADGRFQVGVLTGSWAKPSAEYIGEGAREAARRARIDVLDGELAVLEGQLALLAHEREEVSVRRRTLDSEVAALPDDAPLRQAHARAGEAAQAVRRTKERHDERATEVAEAVGRAEQAHATLTGTATELTLPADPDGLAAVRQALHAYTVALAALWPALRARDEAEAAVARERAEAEQTAQRVAELALRVEGLAREAAAATERLTTLRSTVGAAVAELERRLDDTARELARTETERRATALTEKAADQRAQRAAGRIEQLDQDVAESTAQRADAIAQLQRFAGTGLLALALPGIDVPDPAGEPWAATPAIALARTVEAELARTDASDDALERVQSHLNAELKKLQDGLSRGGHSASARTVEDGVLVDIVYQGRERGVAELAEALATEVEDLQRILSAHEREILETHLLSEVAGTLQDLIGTAERQVREMNRELDERPTSTGMRLRLVWRASRDAPAGLGQARDRLRQSADAWSREDRAAVGEFLQAQIARHQAQDTSGSWLEHLTEALDYRAWHEFGVERQQHGKWVPATGPASGGERALAVSVPLFAAASSHYASAAYPHAPRLVTLDEAFAGVDDDSRAKCLGLLHAFDLDVVMTSEREWACYPSVPGIAIAQLSRVDEVAAVLVTRWEWDGTARTRVEEPETAGQREPDAGEEAGVLW